VIGKGRLIADTSVEEFTPSSFRQSVYVRSPQAAELPARCRDAGATVRAGRCGEIRQLDTCKQVRSCMTSVCKAAPIGELRRRASASHNSCSAASHTRMATQSIDIPIRRSVIAGQTLGYGLWSTPGIAFAIRAPVRHAGVRRDDRGARGPPVPCSVRMV
jgi:hypothetical protein